MFAISPEQLAMYKQFDLVLAHNQEGIQQVNERIIDENKEVSDLLIAVYKYFAHCPFFEGCSEDWTDDIISKTVPLTTMGYRNPTHIIDPVLISYGVQQ
jgi:hypothetical protein